MEYGPNFVRSFMNRTNSLLEDNNDSELGATFLINCLLGLLVAPKDKLFSKIPETDFDSLSEWGINPKSIKVFKCDMGCKHNPNLRQLVHRLRNAIAHFDIEPQHSNGKVIGYSFKDQKRFHAILSLDEIKEFVTRLTTYLENQR